MELYKLYLANYWYTFQWIYYRCFDQISIQNHDYSIYIPNDTEKIILEIESKYIEFYYDEGRKKINTLNPEKSTKKLEIVDNKYIFSINAKEKNLIGKYISFVIKPITFKSNIFSFYYFRFLYFRKNNDIVYPIDSYLGNLCNPKYDDDKKKYYCYFELKNN